MFEKVLYLLIGTAFGLSVGVFVANTFFDTTVKECINSGQNSVNTLIDGDVATSCK